MSIFLIKKLINNVKKRQIELKLRKITSTSLEKISGHSIIRLVTIRQNEQKTAKLKNLHQFKNTINFKIMETIGKQLKTSNMLMII